MARPRIPKTDSDAAAAVRTAIDALNKATKHATAVGLTVMVRPDPDNPPGVLFDIYRRL